MLLKIGTEKWVMRGRGMLISASIFICIADYFSGKMPSHVPR